MREPLRHGVGHDPRLACVSPPSEMTGAQRPDGAAGASQPIPGHLTLELDVSEWRSSMAETEAPAWTADRGGPESQEPAQEPLDWPDSVAEEMRLGAAEMPHPYTTEGFGYLTIEMDEEALEAGLPWQSPKVQE